MNKRKINCLYSHLVLSKVYLLLFDSQVIPCQVSSQPPEIKKTQQQTFGNSKKTLLRNDPAEQTAETPCLRIEEDQPELSASFYVERNPADQAPPHHYQPFSLDNFQPPSPLELPTDPVGPITMTSYMNPAPQNGAHAKEYGLNKPTPFNGNRTKVKVFSQECLVYINMNEDVYVMDKLKIGFVLSYMNEKEVKDWRELYLKDIEDPATEKLVYPTFGTFLTEVCKAFQSAD